MSEYVPDRDETQRLILAQLERIATALEQAVLERVDNSHQPFITTPRAMIDSDPYPQELEPVDLPPVAVTPQQVADLCPIHNAPWKTVPAGVSKKTGKPYTAFRACSVAGCDQRPRL